MNMVLDQHKRFQLLSFSFRQNVLAMHRIRNGRGASCFVMVESRHGWLQTMNVKSAGCLLQKFEVTPESIQPEFYLLE